MLSLTDPTAKGAGRAPAAIEAAAPAPIPGYRSSPLRRRPCGVADLGRRWLHRPWRGVRSKGERCRTAGCGAQCGGKLAREAARLVHGTTDTATRFKGALARASGSHGRPPAARRSEGGGQALGCSSTSAAGRWRRGAARLPGRPRRSVDGVGIRAIVPVNLRGGGEDGDVRSSNHFGLVSSPAARLGHRWSALRGPQPHARAEVYQPLIALGLLNAWATGPGPIQSSVTAVCSAAARAWCDQRPRTHPPALPRGSASPSWISGCRIPAASAWACRSSPTTGVSVRRDHRCRLVRGSKSHVGRFGRRVRELLWLTLMTVGRRSCRGGGCCRGGARAEALQDP